MFIRTKASLLSTFLLISLLGLTLSGCQTRYGANRVYDFCDIFQAGIGITTENAESGVIPPAFGLHLQVTEYLNLGAVRFAGQTYEMDGRGFFAGPEDRTRFGLGPNQLVRIEQNYEEGHYNYFKKVEGSWTKRMNSILMRWKERPAKDLEYDFYADTLHVGSPIMHRGWQYWENIGVEAAICEPFLTHWGLDLRLGFDPSEISDWLLGICTVDFKKDDLTEGEFSELFQ